ncbi:seipin-2 isoform X1 [Salvia miltiorrhiza]|uniref:seipin-2 isoform X1 n=1 Tax=Salvia miltiorrhiza TaxID=226208 RepID=UPI0025AB9A77|nr:seipin-2 isoform X1 [Salvia miltiorrhiza]
MEETKSSAQFDDDEDAFHDALDEFEFYDCRENFSDPIESNRDESISDPGPYPPLEDKSPPPAVLRRRRSRSSKKSSGDDSAKLGTPESVDKYLRERKVSLSRKFEEYEKGLEDTKLALLRNEMSEEKSTITDANAAARVEESNSRGSDDSNSSLLFTLAGIVIKPISFQIHLLVKIFTFTIRLAYYSYMIVFNPLGLLMAFRGYIIQQLKKIWNLMFGIVSEYVYEWLKEQRAIWKLGLKCGWGLLWSAYVCAVLVGLLMSAFVMGGVLIKVVVEEPIRMSRSLNFDYSEKSPVALVPIMSNVRMNQDVKHLVEKPEIMKSGRSRVVPRDHGVQVTVSLTLPESEYNQHLGIFQIRVDFLAADGQILATSRRPCMLQYRSQSIRLLLTFLKVAPILTGYTSETQYLKANFKDFTEGDPPTACLRVVLEQRAEYSPGAGIPEIYSASLTLESELPLPKRILWFWKKTLFVWVSMTVFMMELVFALLCCRPLIIPKIRLWEATPRDAASHHDRPRQS